MAVENGDTGFLILLQLDSLPGREVKMESYLCK